MSKLLEWIVAISQANTKFVVAFFGLMSFAVSYLMGASEKLGELITQFDAISKPAFAAVSINCSPLSLMNYFLPLDEACTLFIAWLALYMSCVSLRMLKALIPFIA